MAGPLPAKRAAIVDAAVSVFVREGYSRASVDVIAERARVSKQTVYNHFGNKESLFLHAVECERRRVARALAQDTAVCPRGDGPPTPTEDGDAASALEAIGRRLLRGLLDERSAALRRLIISEVARHPSLRTAYTQHASQRLVDEAAAVLSERTEKGELAVPEPAAAAGQFIALLVQQGLSRTMYGTVPLDEEDAAVMCERAADLVVRAYRA